MESRPSMQNQQFRQGAELAKTRDQALHLRVKVQASHGKIKHCIRHFDESREAFMNVVKSSRGAQSNVEALDQADAQLREDCETLQSAMEELRALHMTLSKLDFDLFTEDQRQYDIQSGLDRLLDSGEVASSTIETITAGRDLSDAGSQGHELHPLLEEYFDVVGDRALLRERIDYELPHEQAEKERHRQRIRDQDEVLSTDDADFELSLRVEREALEAELEHQNSRVQELLKKCLKAGLDTDPTKYARRSDSGSSISQGRSNIERWLGSVKPEGHLSDIDHSERSDSWSGSEPKSGMPSNARESDEHNVDDHKKQESQSEEATALSSATIGHSPAQHGFGPDEMTSETLAERDGSIACLQRRSPRDR